MARSRLQNAKRNILGGVLGQFLAIVSTFVARTVLINNLGPLYAGLSSLFSSVLQVLSLAELGFGTALTFSMYAPIASGDTQQVNALLKLYKRIYHYIGLAVLLIGAGCLPILPRLVHGELPPDTNLYILYAITLLDISISYHTVSHRWALLVADQKSYLTNIIGTALSLLTNVAQICVLIFLNNFYLYYILMPLSTSIKLLFIFLTTRRMYPQYRCEGEVPRDTVQNIMKQVTGLFIEKLAGVSRNSFDSMIISSFLGLQVLTIYSNYYSILGAVSGVTGAITIALTSSIGHAIATETPEKNYQHFQSIQLLYMWIAAFCTTCLYCMFQPFMKLWLGEKLMLGQGVMALMCLYFFTAKMGNVCSAYRQAAGLWWSDKLRPVVEAASNLTMNILLVRWLGVSGVVLASILSLIFINSMWGSRALFRLYFVGEKQSLYLLRLLLYAAVTALSCIAASWLCRLLPFEGIFGLIVRGLVCLAVTVTLVPALLSWLPEFRDALNMAKRILHRHA